MVAPVNSVQKPQESIMSQSMETFLRQNGAGIDITTWNQLVASPAPPCTPQRRAQIGQRQSHPLIVASQRAQRAPHASDRP